MGVVRIMEKLIEHLEFIGVVSQIRYTTFVSGDESERSTLKVEVDFDSCEPNVSDFGSSHTTSLNDSLLAFDTMDHASLLGLGNLDMEGMR